MSLLVIGLALWFAAHLVKRLAPSLRQSLTDRMGQASKGLFAALIVVSVVLMVMGYRRTEFIPVWDPPGFMVHLNNLLMVVALYTYGAGGPKGAKVWLGTKLRHPQLVGFSIWAAAHLLVNGDLAAIILFGGLLGWALVSMSVINRAEGLWTPPERAEPKKEVGLVVITIVLFAAITALHSWLGRWPFPG